MSSQFFIIEWFIVEYTYTNYNALSSMKNFTRHIKAIKKNGDDKKGQ